MTLPPVDTQYLIDFLTGLLNTPSPTGRAFPAIEYCEQALAAFPGLTLRRTRKGALLVTWPGEDPTHPRADRPRGYAGRDGQGDQDQRPP